MERLHCSRCDEDYLLNTGCSCCAPLPGPFRCPRCGAVLDGAERPYFISQNGDMD